MSIAKIKKQPRHENLDEFSKLANYVEGLHGTQGRTHHENLLGIKNVYAHLLQMHKYIFQDMYEWAKPL